MEAEGAMHVEDSLCVIVDMAKFCKKNDTLIRNNIFSNTTDLSLVKPSLINV